MYMLMIEAYTMKICRGHWWVHGDDIDANLETITMQTNELVA